MSAEYIQGHFRLESFMGACTMSLDQNALSEQSDLVPYCLQYSLLKNISRRGE